MLRCFVLLASISLCAGGVFPLVPGDNSHYVEGESRYIWMPDGDGTPHLVDLHAPATAASDARKRSGANNQYWLYTRLNPDTPQILLHNNVSSIKSSNYQPNRATKVITHGWLANGRSPINTEITSAFLAVGDVNVIVLDWDRLANGLYSTAVKNVPSIGQHLGDFLQWLIDTAGGDWSGVHLVGHSLGAHVMGNAGRRVSGRPWRITGLDPAGPQWRDNPNALSRVAGVHVETIHTDGGLLGILEPIADVDFYPNGGKNPQPGCWISTCSHSRAWELFASSIKNDHFVGRLCSNLDEAQSVSCNGTKFMNMGNSILYKRGSGIFGLTTGRKWPF